MQTVHINRATPRQLSVLWGLRPDEVDRLVAARPFTDLFTLRRTLPVRVALRVRAFETPKLDLNTLAQDDLVAQVGLTPGAARAMVKGRPYYFVNELRHVPGLTPQEVELLTSVAELPELSYVDKSSGRSVTLAPDPSKVMVNFGETEADTVAVGNALGLTRAYPKRGRSGPQVFTISESEAAGDVLGQLKRKPGVDKVVPGFREGDEQRFLDPEFCVVQFHVDVPPERQAAIVAQTGLEVAERHRSPGLLTLRIPKARTAPGDLPAKLQVLNALPEVQFAEPNFLGFDDMESAAGLDQGGSRWHLDLIHLAQAWAFGQGSPEVVVAVIDSGVDVGHPALKGALLQRKPTDDWDFTVDGGADPLDDEGHGTFIAGILVGNGVQNVQGICPNCRLLPLKVPLTGQANSYARRADAILYAVDYAGTRRLVINTSWKTTGDVAVVRQAIATAQQRGAIIVASAGNDPERKNQPHFPSDYPQAISVAAVRPDRGRAFYSFFGDRINVAAPGGAGADPSNAAVDLLSAAPSGNVTVAFGTSFAAPHVAGVAALILSQNPVLTPAEVLTILQGTAVALQDEGLGRGLIDAAAAVTRARATTTATRPTTCSGEGLAAINRGDVDALTGRFGILRLTARLLVSRRPVTDITLIRNALGLTAEQYLRLAGCSERSARPSS